MFIYPSLLDRVITVIREKYSLYNEEKTYYTKFEEIQIGRLTVSLGRDLRFLFNFYSKNFSERRKEK